MRNHYKKAGISALAFLLAAVAAQTAQKADKKAESDEARPLPLRAPVDVSSYFFPSGWMGDFQGDKGKKLLDLTTAFKGKPRQGSQTGLCIKLTYRGSTWAGVYWQSPDGNWGDKLGRTVTGASRVTFWASGEQGGEVVEFKSGGSGAGYKYRDTFEATTGQFALERDWKPYEIGLANQDLKNVVGAFACIVHGDATRNGGTAVYIDRIRFE